MLAAAVVGTGLIAAAGAGAAITAGASAYIYKKKQRKKEKKKKAKKERAVFGQHLEEVTRLSDNDLPIVFDYTITWLEENGMGVENLFSLNRSPIRAGELAREFDDMEEEGKQPDLSAEDPGDVALLLIQYLQDLPEPLCTIVLYEDFVQIEKEDNIEDWIEAMRALLLQLPDINLRVIRRLVKFLDFYCNEQQTICNIPEQRTADNVSKVFGRLVFNTWEAEQNNDFDSQTISDTLFRKLLVNFSRVFYSTGSSLFESDMAALGTQRGVPKGISLEKTPQSNPKRISLSKPSAEISAIQKEKKLPTPPRPPSEESKCTFNMDTITAPEMNFVCSEAPSEVGSIDLSKKPLPQPGQRLSKSGVAVPLKPLPTPPSSN